MKQPSAIIIGAGIVGLATARALAIRGYKVTVFERNERAVGASIRNFGMVWPIGQATGPLFERAMLSRSIWKEICTEARIWHDEVGSLHLAYSADELQVISEYVEANHQHRDCGLLNAKQALQKSPAVNPTRLKGALWSSEEMIVESRVAVGQIAAYLAEKYDVEFFWNTAISQIEPPSVKSGRRSWKADEIFVCSGADFETLYPELFLETQITKCKLQMMRLVSQPDEWRIGPALCGGLSMIHYPGFQAATSLPELRKRYEEQYGNYLEWGIHVMASQNGSGELTIGDSHEYGLVHDPFDKEFINNLIIAYLQTFAIFKDWKMMQSWHGIYPKMTNGQTEFITGAEPGVTIINGLGGNGMTLSFGLCEQYIANR
ncbi:TIGR03364 family FAD-dependent oxidoreductase [Mucilaginibacter gotjawali]|uniref:Bifunctional tRNA (Mnm(5)s(2)U34)-methyltransferase/FAD-dependent cmnm(5)s(2)U34 oxidoreductase n=2 Tax=Mucilaginibacter gotjawali TaxID=1550579 RepID=A0A0X8X277_9SPHI|nr:TIGR03364 family FAD-dependent oxidoreductase [Mucilaginibacter gotjawali]MBB3058813.1 FAD dependent oxidoreductase TIGR03364 [Mucilaginibacter gotjawali]BAU53807.1 bifunctional tRNA (mnm(5)s(2)U34)-methyltransferase/FAD-dependent cmnm(5)s(2)U34 oxidoreductase [Mucilaginibacter gotjawali]